ncbi:MAG: hypothetical protein WCC87_16535 [Candidatus Korobacteraceae bacterium]
MGFPTKALTVLLGSALSGFALMSAQTPVSSSAAAPPSESRDTNYPEQGYLSASHYLNQYFDFTFEFSPDAHLRPIPQSAARDGSLQLLELGGPPPMDAEISIAAIPVGTGTNQDAKAFLRYALDQELFRGVEELRALSKIELSGHQFYFFETRRGVEQHMLLATTLDGYILRVMVAAHDPKTLKELESLFQHVVFFSPAELQRHLDATAQAYDGPGISSHRLASLQADPPVAHIDPGKIGGDFYENPTLGFSYRIPQGWTLEAEGAVQPAVERDRARQNFGHPALGATERRLLEACSRTLFSAWQRRPGPDGQIPYDDFGEVTVSAIAAACFPGMKFPQDVNDRAGFKDFLLHYGVTHPILTNMRDAKVFAADGSIFLFLHGTVAFQIPNDELSRRLSIAMAVTERRGYVLTWFFAAPHDSELQQLTDERVIFDPASASKVAGATQPGGGIASSAADTPPAAAASTPASATATPPQTAAAAQSPTDRTPAAASGTNSASAATEGDQQQPSAPSHPSLLRPGETMESQQGKGARIPNKQNPSD